MNEGPAWGAPITVALRTLSPGSKMYGFRSGLRTLKASIALSQTEMPALVIEGASRRLFPNARRASGPLPRLHCERWGQPNSQA